MWVRYYPPPREPNSMNDIANDNPLASFRLDDRLIVVTGSSEGIGRVFAESFARAGAFVVLASRRPDKLEAVRQSIAASGGRAEVVATDVSRLADIRALAQTVRRLVEREARHLVLVNNAGLRFTKPALEVVEQDWDTLFDVHVKGAFFCAQQIAPLMIARRYGKIINLSSTWSVATDAGKSAYCAAKAAISHLTAALSTEWAPLGVRVNALAPSTTVTGSVQTMIATNPERSERLLSRVKLGRFAQPSDLVGSAVFLASGASDFITGQTLFVDGGFTT
jgi:NAD(P)-dependent dehydrogenase (short-subunit alcohol dehydrogenase family)